MDGSILGILPIWTRKDISLLWTEKKDLIISGGYNIYPREIEEVLYEHPKVADAAVIGVSHKTRGEIVKAYVVPKPGMELDKREIIAFCRQNWQIIRSLNKSKSETSSLRLL